MKLNCDGLVSCLAFNLDLRCYTKAMMSLPATKGFEIGSGFGGSATKGSDHNDEFYMGADGRCLHSSTFQLNLSRFSHKRHHKRP